MNQTNLPMVAALEQFWRRLRKKKYLIRPFGGSTVAPIEVWPAQRRMFDAMLRQARAGKPIRIINLKARKVGASTLGQILAYDLTKHHKHTQAVTIAHDQDTTSELFDIALRAFDNDPDPIHEKIPDNRRQIRYRGAHGSSFKTLTAGGRHKASGFSPTMLVLSELAKWPGDVMSNLASMLNSLPENPFSVCIIESTASMQDASGQFEKRWKAAVAGEGGGFIPIFTSWLDHPHYRSPLGPDGLGKVTDYEVSLRERGATDEQLQWRRIRIGDLGSELYFKQEFPSTPDEAFQVAEGRIFPMLDMRKHNLRIGADELLGADRYRGVDWGGSNPFCCLWLAHWPNKPTALTIDAAACPNTWNSFFKWTRDDHGKPDEKNKHAIDCCRYPVTTMYLRGHVHIYRELYAPNHTSYGEGESDLAVKIMQMTMGEKILATIGDRTRPNSILEFTKLGIPTMPNPTPKTTTFGEVEDGIALLSSMLFATVSLRPEQLAPPDPRLTLARHSGIMESVGGGARLGDGAFSPQETGKQLGLHPIFGVCG